MGIHYDYKSTRGDKKMRKQQEREERRRRKKKNIDRSPNNTIPEDVVLTLDMITDPNRWSTEIYVKTLRRLLGDQVQSC